MKPSVRFRSLTPIIGFTALVLTCASAVMAWPQDARERLQNLRVMPSDQYPRVWFFRSSAFWAAHKRYDYDQWHAAYRRLMGIQGKMLQEELASRSDRALRFFNRFKKAHPNQLALLHYNGNARDPIYRRDRFFAGHWLYREGAKILSDVPAQDGETVIKVSNAGRFRLKKGRYEKLNDDIGLCRLNDDGTPNWHESEQVKLLDMDRQAGTIRVKRGCYGTEPMKFAAKEAYAAAHHTEGPWGRRHNLMWYYNYSTTCPKDGDGRNCADIHLQYLTDLFAPDGELARFDGIEFDVLHNHCPSQADCNADGRADGGNIGGVNTYGIGVIRFARQLRKQLGNDRLILADGGHTRSQRAFGILNGIESEGFPRATDFKFRKWSSGMNRHFFWRDNGRRPLLNYVNHKFVQRTSEPGRIRRPDVPFKNHRLAFAAAVFTDSAICVGGVPGQPKDQIIGIWDEMWMGKAKKLGWLGAPIAPTQRMAFRQPDLLNGAGSPPTGDFLKHVQADDAIVQLDGNAVNLEAKDPDADELTFAIEDLPANGRDLVVRITARAARRHEYPPESARLMRVHLQKGGTTGMKVRGKPETPLTEESGAYVRYSNLATINDEGHGSFFVHPPWRDDRPGYVYWQRTVKLPQDPMLEFYTGMGYKSPERSDGIVFSVEIAPIENSDVGKSQQIYRTRQKAHEWNRHRVSLKKWAGEKVRLKFIADCGPEDDTTTDHGRWGAVRVISPQSDRQPINLMGRVDMDRSPMTWINEKPFTSSFYFSDVTGSTISLTFQIESAEPIWLQEIALHAHPDAMYRQFDGGLVLANPSPRPYTFDMQKLFGDAQFRRIDGQNWQDPETNNGTPIGSKLQLRPKEGLFVVER